MADSCELLSYIFHASVYIHSSNGDTFSVVGFCLLEVAGIKQRGCEKVTGMTLFKHFL